MKKLQLIAVTAFIFIAIACNKDQQAVKKLDGTWKVTEVNGEPPSENNPESMGFSEITFNACKLADNEYCDGSILLFGILNVPIEFNVQDGGDKIGFKTPDLNPSDSTTTSNDVIIDIVELTNKELTLQLDGSVLELEKK